MPKEEKSNERNTPCFVWELTLGVLREGQSDITYRDVHAGLRPYCKKYVFQLERGTERTERNPEGYLHFQCRITLIKKHRAGEIAQIFRETNGWHQLKVLPTSNNSRTQEAFYCMKADTREAGPWKDSDYEERHELPWPYNEITEWWPWQKDLENMMMQRTPRIIHYVVEGQGCVGKTSIVMKLCCEHGARRVPAMNSIEDMCGWVMSFKSNKMYVIDMPRALPKKNMHGFFSGIEYLKDGYAYDKRYHGKERFFDSPNIVVFSNRFPYLKYLSRDRWKLWTIRDKTLIPLVYNPNWRRNAQNEEEGELSDDGEQEEEDDEDSEEVSVRSEGEGETRSDGEEDDCEDV